ncbi:hypothetical protein DERP_003002 [Dermatophagoides pteronyssinus]|uniref:Uncharacterized protein n=1 Tax=Dermatophagoides pteronyssinus TaxID=6956 RepID=A0ABQ8JWP1_DERPT|nr:hypothetical protein DERP_003002 [Dermatophagoides pteronyssinus]
MKARMEESYRCRLVLQSSSFCSRHQIDVYVVAYESPCQQSFLTILSYIWFENDEKFAMNSIEI